MDTKNIIGSVFIVAIMIYSCKKENLGDCIKGTGAIVKEERTVPHVRNFSFAHGRINCYFTQDSIYKVEVEAGKNLIGLIRTEVIGDTLFISNRNKCNFVRSYKPEINIYVSTPDLKAIVQDGVGKIVTTNTIKQDSLIVETWSSGDITVTVDCKYFKTHLHTGTTVTASGSAALHESFMWHNSTFFGEGLSNKTTYVYQNTTGNFHCRTDSLLTVEMLLTGDVIYTGNPVVKVVDLGGTGKVIKK